MEGFMNMVEKVYPGDAETQAKAVKQLQAFRSMQGLFGRPAALTAAAEMPAHAWWSIYGACTPELQKVAVQVLSQVLATDCFLFHKCSHMSGTLCISTC